MNTINIVTKFLAIALGGLSVVNPLAEEWGSGDHVGAINNAVQSGATLASAATNDQALKDAITVAATGVAPIINEVVGLVNAVKSLTQQKPAA